MSISRRTFLGTSTGISAAAWAAADRALAQAQGSAPPPPPAPAAAATGAGSGPGKTPAWQFGPFDDLRGYIHELERRGLLLKVRDIDQDNYEATALMYRLVDKFGMYEAPCLYMENVRIDGHWHKGPIIANHFGHWDTECLSFGLEPVPGDHFATYYKACARVDEYLKLGKGGAFPEAPFREVARDQAACKQVVLTGDAIDITQFAFIQSNPMDGGRYVNTGSVFTNDKDLGKNFGTYRCQIKGPKMLGVNPEPNQGAWQAFMKAKERGEKSVPVSIVLGQDPITWVVSSSKLNRAKADELTVVSAIRGRPLDVVRSETNDHLVPANAEIVIEGEVVLDESMKAEGPFGEMYGYMGKKKAENFWMNIRCITHRRNPWIVNSFTGQTRGFQTAPLEQLAVATMKRFVPAVKFLHSPVEATGFTFVSIKKTKPGQALEVGKRIAEIVGIAKVVVVVDDDLEVLDRVQMMHAMGSRWQPQPATLMIPKARGMPLDPSLIDPPYTSKIVIDATRQLPEEGGPQEYQLLNRTALSTMAPKSFEIAERNWKKHVGKWRPPL